MTTKIAEKRMGREKEVVVYDLDSLGLGAMVAVMRRVIFAPHRTSPGRRNCETGLFVISRSGSFVLPRKCISGMRI